MTQNPNHNPENPYTSALQEMSLEQLEVFFDLYRCNILRERKSSKDLPEAVGDISSFLLCFRASHTPSI